MNSFSIALFLHIIGALGVSIALGVEWLGMAQIRKSTAPDEIRVFLRVIKSTTRFGFISMLTTVITGIYMVLAGLGWIPWILAVIGALILVIILTRTLTVPRMVVIGKTLAIEKGPVSQTFQKLLNDPILWISIQTRVAIVLGIIFLKIAKPNLGGALLTIGTAVVVGIASVLPMLRSVQTSAESTD